MNLFQRIWHWFAGCQSKPDREGQVYCTRCGRFLWG